MVSTSTAAQSEDFRPATSQAERLYDFGTRPIFNSDHDMMRDSVRKWWEKEVVPNHAQWEKDGQVSRELWHSAGANGLLAMTTPEEYGGPGFDIMDASIMWDEQGYTGCTGPGFAIHSDICGPYIVNWGTEEQKHQWMPGLCSGEAIAALGMTEPGAGSDLQGMKTVARRDGDDWIINGSKVFITNGAMADLVLVCCKTDPEARGARGISIFLVDTTLPGFVKGKKLDKVGYKAQDTSELFFEDLRVPHSAIIGGEKGLNRGFQMMMTELPQERLLIAAIGVASAEACFEWTRDYVKERKAFGNNLFDGCQTIRHKLAELKTEIAVARAFYDQCLALHADGKLDTSMASMAKYYCTDLQCKVATECLQLHGGWGYMMEYPIARAFIDSRVQPIYGGANEIMKELIARTI
jgi:long-chain-acyl-CoA dehydrogenase